MMFQGLLEARLKVEYAYFKMMGALEILKCTWATEGVLCILDENEVMTLSF